MKLQTAVILAAGSGQRMRRQDPSAMLTADQLAAAESGIKALVPIERPFLDYSLGTLAKAGFTRVCLVVSGHQEALITHLQRLQTTRLEIRMALQAEPRGTADAVLAAESVIGSEGEFAVLNGDTYYSLEVLEALQTLEGVGLVAFDRAGLLAGRQTNLDRQRMARFAIVRADSNDRLVQILEKPDAATYDSLPEPVLVSLNCWRFSPAIFRACERISVSRRGELELTSAVQYCVDDLGVSFRVMTSSAPVLDLSERGDIPAVSGYLEGVEVDL